MSILDQTLRSSMKFALDIVNLKFPSAPDSVVANVGFRVQFTLLAANIGQKE